MERRNLNDYVGKRIGIIKILERQGDSFKIQCDCGTIKVRGIQNIFNSEKKGNVVSCGCKRNENIGKKKVGVESHRKVHFTQEQINDIISKHKQEISLDTIAKEYGYSQPVIRNLVKSLGFKPRNRRNNTNETFFDVIDTEEKAYWLGYLAADGTIRVRTNGIDKNGRVKTRGNSINLKLSVNDEKHLMRFRDLVSPNTVLRYHVSEVTTRKGNLSISHNVILGLNSNYMVAQIIDKGVTPRKSHTLDKPNIDPKFYRDYIRGYFDGDGTCVVTKKPGVLKDETMTVKYSFACASEKHRNFIASVLKEEIDVDTTTYGDINLTILGGFTAYKKFFHYLYDGSTIYLERKYEKGLEMINYIPYR